MCYHHWREIGMLDSSRAFKADRLANASYMGFAHGNFFFSIHLAKKDDGSF